MTQRTGLFANAVRAAGAFWARMTQPSRLTGGRRYSSGRTGAGVYVDADTALKNATVWACIQYLSRTVAQVPWRVMRDDPQKGKSPQPTHPADYLLNKRPNPEMGAFTFRQTLVQWAVRFGNGYAEIERDNRGAVYALWPIHPSRVTPRREGGELVYDVANANGAYGTTLSAMDMFHIRGFGDGVVGISVFEFAAESVGWAQATEIFGATYFGEGMNPSGVVETPNRLSPDALNILREELDRLYKGPKGKRTVILDAGLKFTALSTTPENAQFIETRQHQVEEICRWFGVPPHKVQHLLRATFSNIEHQSIEVVIDSITPWVRILEDEADYKLFGAQNRAGYYTKLYLQALMRGDAKSRAEFYQLMRGLSGLNANEIRELEDLNPIGPDGDVYLVPANMMTLQRAIALGNAPIPDPNAAKLPPPAADPSNDPSDEPPAPPPAQEA